MMKTHRIWALLCTVMVCVSCTSGSEQPASHLRLISMIPDTQASLTIRNTRGDHPKKTVDLPYADPVSYQMMSPGKYEFSYRTGDQKVLETEYVIGRDGWYTLIITGLMPDNVRPNMKTTKYKLERILAGSEATGTNGFLPMLFLIRDNYDGSKKQAYLRILNVSPTFDQLTIRKDDKPYGHVAYPKETEIHKLKPGEHHFSFYHKKIEVGNTTIAAKPGYIYTILAGDPAEASPDTLRLPVLRNPSRTLLKKKQ